MFTYAPISPIILPVGAIYFLAAFLVYKTQLICVFAPGCDSGGVMFPTACQLTLFGLVCGQITLVGYTVLRQGFYQPMLLLPLPIYTFAMMAYFKRIFEDPAGNLSVERAIELDKIGPPIFDESVYRQPILIEEDLEPTPYRGLQENPKPSRDDDTGGLGAEKLV